MNKFQYINQNGNLIRKEDCILNSSNRAFLYGDGLFETIHANGTICQFLDSHFFRLIHGLNELKITIPPHFTLNYFEEQISNLLNKNRIYKGARIRVTAFRNSEGFYSPVDNNFSFIMTAEELSEEYFKLNSKGMLIDLYLNDKKTINRFSNLKTLNALLYILAGIYKNENEFDECILLNEKGHVCESISSNVFIVEKDIIYTPPLSDGCVDGIMRKNLIRIAKTNNIKIIDNESIDISRIATADEIFFTNAIRGVQWALAYKQKRYFNFTSKKLNVLLNKEAFNLK